MDLLEHDLYVKKDSDGKVILYRERRDTRNMTTYTVIEAIVLCGVFLFSFYACFHFDSLHCHITHAYASLGHAHAQHAMGLRYIQGLSVRKNRTAAVHWFKKAADQGHPHSAFNLALIHVQGHKTGLKREEARKLLKHASSNGISEASHVISHCEANICNI